MRAIKTAADERRLRGLCMVLKPQIGGRSGNAKLVSQVAQGCQYATAQPEGLPDSAGGRSIAETDHPAVTEKNQQAGKVCREIPSQCFCDPQCSLFQCECFPAAFTRLARTDNRPAV